MADNIAQLTDLRNIEVKYLNNPSIIDMVVWMDGFISLSALRYAQGNYSIKILRTMFSNSLTSSAPRSSQMIEQYNYKQCLSLDV